MKKIEKSEHTHIYWSSLQFKFRGRGTLDWQTKTMTSSVEAWPRHGQGKWATIVRAEQGHYVTSVADRSYVQRWEEEAARRAVRPYKGQRAMHHTTFHLGATPTDYVTHSAYVSVAHSLSKWVSVCKEPIRIGIRLPATVRSESRTKRRPSSQILIGQFAGSLLNWDWLFLNAWT